MVTEKKMYKMQSNCKDTCLASSPPSMGTCMYREGEGYVNLSFTKTSRFSIVTVEFVNIEETAKKIPLKWCILFTLNY